MCLRRRIKYNRIIKQRKDQNQTMLGIKILLMIGESNNITITKKKTNIKCNLTYLEKEYNISIEPIWTSAFSLSSDPHYYIVNINEFEIEIGYYASEKLYKLLTDFNSFIKKINKKDKYNNIITLLNKIKIKEDG